MWLFWKIGLLILYPLLTNQYSLPGSQSYIGAVVEYTPVIVTEDGRSLGEINAENYVKFIKKAKEYSVDIIVMPESSLSLASSKNATIARSEAASYIPDPKDKVAPCDDDKNKYAKSLTIISCAARENKIYVVLNHREKVDCPVNTPGCPADGYLIYNTHATLDRDGRVISRYRKYNLFGEHGTNNTVKPEPTVFETDFGVKFGQFVCFDILFESPAVDLVRDYGVTDVVYSLHWFSEMPYAFNNEVQAAWAYSTDTNFLAAGHNNPRTGSGGSGIFIGRKGHAHVVSSDLPSNVLVVAEIPKKGKNGHRLLDIDRQKIHIYEFNNTEISTSHEPMAEPVGNFVYHVTNLSDYTSELIEITKNRSIFNRTLCNNGLCCEFAMKVGFNASVVNPGDVYYRYRMVSYNNVMSFAGRGSGKTQICGILGCINETLESCGRFFNSTERKVVAPTMIDIKINVPAGGGTNKIVYLPVTLQRNDAVSSPMPLNVTEFAIDEFKQKATYEMSLRKPRDDLLTFVVIGRNFGKNSSGALLPILYLLVFIVFGVVKFL